MWLMLINGAGQRKVDSGLKMLFGPIQFWPVASKYYKTDSASNSCSKFESLILVPTIQPRKKQRTGRFSRKLQQDNSINFMSTPILFFGLLAKCKNKERNFIIKRHCCFQGQGRWQFFQDDVRVLQSTGSAATRAIFPSAVKMALLFPDDSLLHFSQLKSGFYRQKWDTFHFEKVQPSNVVLTSDGFN